MEGVGGDFCHLERNFLAGSVDRREADSLLEGLLRDEFLVVEVLVGVELVEVELLDDVGVDEGRVRFAFVGRAFGVPGLGRLHDRRRIVLPFGERRIDGLAARVGEGAPHVVHLLLPAVQLVVELVQVLLLLPVVVRVLVLHPSPLAAVHRVVRFAHFISLLLFPRGLGFWGDRKSVV